MPLCGMAKRIRKQRARLMNPGAPLTIRSSGLGQQEDLINPRMMGKKEAEEKALRDEIARRPELQTNYGGAWDQIATAYRGLLQFAKRTAFTHHLEFGVGNAPT